MMLPFYRGVNGGMGWENNSPLDAQLDRVRHGIAKQSEIDSTLPPAPLQPPQVLREVAMTFGTHICKTEWSSSLLPLCHLSLATLRKGGALSIGDSLTWLLWLSGRAEKLSSEAMSPPQSDSSPQNTPAQTCAHDIKVIFLVAGKAQLSLPLP